MIQRMKMIKARVLNKKVLSFLVYVILTLSISGFAFMHFSSSYNTWIPVSESMVPAINKGDMVITGPVDGIFSGNIENGTIITYERDEITVTHRVIAVHSDTFETKGDASEDPDLFPVSISEIKGVYLFKIPYAGYIRDFLNSEPGLLTLIFPIIALAIMILKDMVKEARRPAEIQVNL